jgi:hypothetical protein
MVARVKEQNKELLVFSKETNTVGGGGSPLGPIRRRQVIKVQEDGLRGRFEDSFILLIPYVPNSIIPCSSSCVLQYSRYSIL